MSEINENQIKEKYAAMNASELRAEYNQIISIPNASTNIEALTKMSALITAYEDQGVPMPKPGRSRSHQSPENSFNIGSFLIGLVILGVGVALTASGGGIFYGAIIVGFITMVKSFFGSDD